MQFLEVPSFTPRMLRLIGEEVFGELQAHLIEHPDAGPVIAGSKGLRKIRWAAKGHGKRGGVRVIYYWHVTPKVITFLDIYPKNEKDTLTRHELKLLNLLLEDTP